LVLMAFSFLGPIGHVICDDSGCSQPR
jgi:hypothetical protein